MYYVKMERKHRVNPASKKSLNPIPTLNDKMSGVYFRLNIQMNMSYKCTQISNSFLLLIGRIKAFIENKSN